MRGTDDVVCCASFHDLVKATHRKTTTIAKNMNRDTLIIYHERKGGRACPDGLAAAWVAHRFYPDSHIMGWQYQAPYPPVVPEGVDNIVVVDFSFPASVIRDWVANGYSVRVIDHHETAMNHLSGLSDMVKGLQGEVDTYFDMNESGATLTYRTLFPSLGSPPAFLQYVKDRDLWNHALPSTRVVHEGVATMRWNIKKQHPKASDYVRAVFELYDLLARLSKAELVMLCAAVAGHKIAELERLEDEIASRWAPFQLNGHDGVVVYLADDGSEDRHVSWVATRVYKHYCPEAEFVAIMPSKGTCELRSDKDKPNSLNVGALAEQCGGGGHHNAAGFSLMNFLLEKAG